MKLIGIKKVYTGEWLAVYNVEYKTASGKTKVYEMISKVGSLRNPGELSLSDINNKTSAVVIAVFNTDMSKILICKEFRMGVNQYVYNFPAGLMENGEFTDATVHRELKEETGLDVADILYKSSPTFTCASVCDDVTEFIIVKADGNLRESDNEIEEIHSKWYSKEEVKSLLSQDKIKFAGRTQAFCLMWAYT